MHYVIMGCGRVGSSLARSLERRGHTVAVIDVAVDAFRRLGPDFQGSTVKGVGFDRDVLTEAGIEGAAGFAAVSNGDNSNILAARVVRENFGVDNVVARIYDQGRAEVYERLGIPTVATVRWTANQVLRRLVPVGSEAVWIDPASAVRLVEVPVHAGWVGRAVRSVEELVRTPIPALTRFGSAIVTSSGTMLQDGDIVYAMVETARVADVEAMLAAAPPQH
ncbi:MAG TPA: TrkA family potassium uptake protein [Propionibacteriaceae bacterium]|nr:TrkA family potassium uptake protein [Propionibacteriaceae bacterium]HPZ50316.1 TrkA family potassium uptake protein [Propionibacteriaceae bacterium]HQE31373.1 TrkA family potassium uptake protein [Propionibacteriaceae bacterium]